MGLHKVFVRAGISGLIYDFRIYVGKNTRKEYNLGFSGDIVQELCSSRPAGQNFKVYFDNWFSLPSLAAALKEKQLFCVGTIRSNRMSKCILTSDNDLKNMGEDLATGKLKQTFV